MQLPHGLAVLGGKPGGQEKYQHTYQLLSYVALVLSHGCLTVVMNALVLTLVLLRVIVTG